MILEATAKAYSGLCARCAKGGGACESCGTRMSQPQQSGKFMCQDCEKARRIENLLKLPKQWKDWKQPADVDWTFVADHYALGINTLLHQFLAVQHQDPAYAVVFQLSQNWMLDVHINTQGGIAQIPDKMRKIANWGRELSDEGWIAKVGVWYTPAWKYGDLGSMFQNEVARTISDFHHDLFEMISSSAEDDVVSEELAAMVDEARLSAIELARNSDAYKGIVKTPDFAAYVVDDDGLDYTSKARLPC
jgi:hypothetical protein